MLGVPCVPGSRFHAGGARVVPTEIRAGSEREYVPGSAPPQGLAPRLRSKTTPLEARRRRVSKMLASEEVPTSEIPRFQVPCLPVPPRRDSTEQVLRGSRGSEHPACGEVPSPTLMVHSERPLGYGFQRFQVPGVPRDPDTVDVFKPKLRPCGPLDAHGGRIAVSAHAAW